jgi:hypothetical protein
VFVTLQLPDGSAQTVDAVGLKLSIDGSPLELSLEASPNRLRVYSPGDDNRWQHFVVHHSAANAMSLELVTHGRKGDDPVPE